MPQKNKKHGGNRHDDLSQFVAPLTPKTFKRELRAASRLQFRPQQRELQGEARAERSTRHKIRDYYKEYGAAVDRAAADTKTAYSDAASQQNAQSAISQANDSALRSRLESQAQADAQLRGATYTPSTVSTQASSARRDSAALLAASTAGQGASQRSYLADRARIGVGSKIDQLQKSRARSRSIAQSKRDLAKAKGDYATDYRRQTRDTERQFYLEQLQAANTRRGQNITRANAQLSAATQRRGQDISNANADASRAVAQQNANTSARNSRTSARNGRSMRQDRAHDNRHPSSSSGGRDPGEVTKGLSLLKSAPKGSFSNWAEAYEYLVGKGISPNAAHDAVRRTVRRAQIAATQ